MATSQSAATQNGGLTHYLSPLNVWALSIGGAVGWGAFVMPGTTLLPKAGPFGTLLGMVIAAVIMIIVAANLNYMIGRYPSSGGAYEFTKRTFGHDHAFLCAWSLILAYVSILWANATSFILIVRFLLGPVFQFGFHYVVAGYDVYFGEILVTLVILFAFGAFSCGAKRVLNGVNTVFALILVVGVLACLFIVVGANGLPEASLDPSFSPSVSPGVGVFGIVALAPWAFLGFESVAHAAGECKFPLKYMFPIMVAGVVCAAVIYVSTTYMSVIGMPEGYQSWFAYISDLGNLSGLDGLPTFHAMQASAGTMGVTLLAVVIIAAISTTLITLYRTSARLIYSVAEDGILPSWFKKLSADGVPRNAILFIMIISVVVPFVGRAAIGWIVDVTSVSAAIVYGYASLCAYRGAREEGNTAITVTSVLGIAASAVFLVYPLVPTIWSVSALDPASYLILAAWSIVGLFLFRLAFMRDKNNNFGKSTVVWILMIFLILFASTMWMRQVSHDSMQETVTNVTEYYEQDYEQRGVYLTEKDKAAEEAHVVELSDVTTSTLLTNSLVQMVLVFISLVLMFNIYALMRRREREHDEQRAEAEQSSKAKTTFLSNMSHDIRTPMNAIIGYTHLARREGTTPEEAQEYLEKIDSSSKHLLALINDVLEMSRIESGKMELDLEPLDLRRTMGEVRDMFATQMREKKIDFTVEADDLNDPVVMCDGNRLNRVLLNLLSNAYKFTPEGGSVSVKLTQLEAPDALTAPAASAAAEADGADAADAMVAREPEGEGAHGGAEVDAGVPRGYYQLRVKDSGIGMTPEFAARVFEAFERERNTTVSGIQGTGLGMAITKSIVELMGGTINIDTAPGEGTEFIIDLSFDLVEGAEGEAVAESADGEQVDFEGMRILLVEDNEINREIAMLVLEDAGFVLDTAENGQIALDKVKASQPGDYDLILMDVQMPVMNGYEATQAIRALEDEQLASIPIVAASANAFAEDVQAARDAGMDGHVAKPLDVPKVLEVLSSILRK